MLGFKSEATASITLASIEPIHMMRKLQSSFGTTAPLPLNQHFTT
jgi:putative transposase